MRRKERQERNQLLMLSSVGMMFPISIVVGYFIGSALDRWFHTGPFLMIFFVVCGIVGAFINLFKEVAEYNRLTDEAPPKDERGASNSHERKE